MGTILAIRFYVMTQNQMLKDENILLCLYVSVCVFSFIVGRKHDIPQGCSSR